MFKTLRDMLLGAVCCAAVGVAAAAVGTPPGTGPGLVDGAWLNGLAGGQNYTYQSGITAAGTTQATATALPTNIYLIEIDTVAASTGVNLPPCLPGTQMQIYNNGAQTLTIYPAVANNPLTAAQDTINNATSITLASHVATSPACAKAGNWYAS
jgi:hypothetical protein